MTTITLTSEVADRLRNAVFGAELRDFEGKVVGYFYPDLSAEQLENYECPLSPEELDRRSKEPGGRSLEDILRDLRKLA